MFHLCCLSFFDLRILINPLVSSNSSLPSGTIFVSMDVTSLYTNIPNNDGIDACREA
jgi:hypothetical protein